MHIVTPETADEACPALSDPAAFRRFFAREGYIVVRKALPAAVCAEAVDGFLKEVHLDTRALFLRHPSASYEAHVYTLAGHMQDPIINLQGISGRRFPQFKAASLALLTDPVLRRAVETLLRAPARLDRSMYFDGCQASSAQRDGAAFDPARPAAMVGAWIAAEDIDPRAGRIFVLPRSHLRPVPGEAGLDPDSARYKAAMADFVAHGPLRPVAPVLAQGDLLLWHALTIHGSSPTTSAACSRRSFSGHYIADSDCLQCQLARGGAGGVMLGGIEVLHHSEQRGVAGRAANLLRSEYPGAYTLLRRLAYLRGWRRPPP